MNNKEIKVLSVNVSTEKGTVKTPVKSIIINNTGIENDAHSGTWHRQISMLAIESFNKFAKELGRDLNYGEFGENITTQGMLLYETSPFDKFVGENIELEVTQIGKKCHGGGCAIYREIGNCVMPKEGIFLRVIKGGEIKNGDVLKYIPKIYKVAVITLSDRASKGEYEDISGPTINKIINDFFVNSKRNASIDRIIIPDDANTLSSTISNYTSQKYDIIITTGGTGIGKRDITPETVKPMLDKEIPGIMDFIRYKYGQDKPNALITRSIAGVINNTMVYCLPGSVKAVTEYTNEILKTIDHIFLMLNNIDNH